jgi:hypothetical protein
LIFQKVRVCSCTPWLQRSAAPGTSNMPAIVKEKNNLIDVGLEYNLIGCGFSTNTNLRLVVFFAHCTCLKKIYIYIYIKYIYIKERNFEGSRAVPIILEASSQILFRAFNLFYIILNYFIRILFLLIIYHICILAPKEFVNLRIKKCNRFLFFIYFFIFLSEI